MKKWMAFSLVVLLISQCFIQVDALGLGFTNPWFASYLSYLVYKFQKNYYATNVLRHLKGIRFSIQPIYDYGYGPWFEVGTRYFNKPYYNNYNNYNKVVYPSNYYNKYQNLQKYQYPKQQYQQYEYDDEYKSVYEKPYY